MAEPRILYRERAPERCLRCGSPRVGPVRSEDVRVGPVDPDDASRVDPGLLECRDCGTIVQWEP